MSYIKFNKSNLINNDLLENLKENYSYLFDDNQINLNKLLDELNLDNSYNVERERELRTKLIWKN